MSQRHRGDEAPLPPKQEVRAHAHGERHRINAKLHQVANEVSGGLDPDDVVEPGAAWKPERHRDAAIAKSKVAKQGRKLRHWKTKMWKRRTNLRRERAEVVRRASS